MSAVGTADFEAAPAPQMGVFIPVPQTSQISGVVSSK